MRDIFVHPKTAQRYPGPGKDRRGNQEWVLQSQQSGSSSTDSFVHQTPQQTAASKSFSCQQCSQLEHWVFLLPPCLALLGVQVQGSKHVCSVWHPAGLWSWPSATLPALGHSRSFEMELGTSSVQTTNSYLQAVSTCSWVKSYFPHLWREREVSMTCPLIWDLSFQVWMTWWSKWFRSSQMNILVKSQLS